jgi:hypothetical protein
MLTWPDPDRPRPRQTDSSRQARTPTGPSGMERGACGNMGHGGTMNPPHKSKECVWETLRLTLRAPYFYPKWGGRRVASAFTRS